MSVIIFEHHPRETPGRLGDVLRDQGNRLEVVELHEGDALPPDLDDVDGLISLGGPMNVDQASAFPWIEGECELLGQAHEAGIPVVGICLGAQLVARALGGRVEPMDEPEVGFAPVNLGFPGKLDPLHAGVPWNMVNFHLHAQQITELPDGASALASTERCPIQTFKAGLKTYCFQYHFEWTKTQIQQMIELNKPMFDKAGVDPQRINDEMRERYDLYRHLGDRLCRNLATLLFPLDKRIPDDGSTVENYRSLA